MTQKLNGRQVNVLKRLNRLSAAELQNNEKYFACFSPNCHCRNINDADRAKRLVWEQGKLSNWLLKKQRKNLNYLPSGFFSPTAPIKLEIAFGVCSDVRNLLASEPHRTEQQE